MVTNNQIRAQLTFFLLSVDFITEVKAIYGKYRGNVHRYRIAFIRLPVLRKVQVNYSTLFSLVQLINKEIQALPSILKVHLVR